MQHRTIRTPIVPGTYVALYFFEMLTTHNWPLCPLQPVWNEIVKETNGEWEAHGNATALTEGGQLAYPAGLTSGQPLNGTASDNGATPRQTLANIDTDFATRAKSPERDITTVRANRAFLTILIVEP